MYWATIWCGNSWESLPTLTLSTSRRQWYARQWMLCNFSKKATFYVQKLLIKPAIPSGWFCKLAITDNIYSIYCLYSHKFAVSAFLDCPWLNNPDLNPPTALHLITLNHLPLWSTDRTVSTPSCLLWFKTVIILIFWLKHWAYTADKKTCENLEFQKNGSSM